MRRAVAVCCRRSHRAGLATSGQPFAPSCHRGAPPWTVACTAPRAEEPLARFPDRSPVSPPGSLPSLAYTYARLQTFSRSDRSAAGGVAFAQMTHGHDSAQQNAPRLAAAPRHRPRKTTTIESMADPSQVRPDSLARIRRNDRKAHKHPPPQAGSRSRSSPSSANASKVSTASAA